MRQRQESCVFLGVSDGFSVGLSFSPFDASTDPNAPVRKTVKVVSRSMKALSFGACDPSGWVTNIKAYKMPKMLIIKTNASVMPIKTIRRAFSCSFVYLRLGFCVKDVSINVFCASASANALRRIALRLLPIFMLLARVARPAVITAATSQP